MSNNPAPQAVRDTVQALTRLQEKAAALGIQPAPPKEQP